MNKNLNVNPFYDEEYQIEKNHWENEGGLPTPADDSNLDNHVPTVEQLEDNVKSAVRKRNNVIKLERGLEDEDWYFGC